ncbi:YwmB family TATA-box binding protein [Desulfitibacter alkalitolerans]|uniref:YwmB family TATA-box binding protein n=1 Tax=Desulfitibacter alkalitolerans TaxID=264641 RepID=UPI000481C980|nr:YwmB family TATA-box binding protein [Desulfitibacter alkalitolerans]
MKKTLFIFIGILCIIAIIKYPAQSNHQIQAIDPFDTLYQMEETKFSELKIAAWAKIKDKNISQQHMEDILALLQKEYNLKFQIQWEGDNNHLTLKAASRLDVNSQDATDKPGQIHINLISANDETYLAVNLEGLMLENSLPQSKKLERIFDYFEARPIINQTAIFFIPGYLSIDNQEKNVYYLFSSINGIIIEGIKEEAFVSYSGYTPHFKDGVESKGKIINVNIASRYHNIDNKTYLYMGTPLIHCQY